MLHEKKILHEKKRPNDGIAIVINIYKLFWLIWYLSASWTLMNGQHWANNSHPSEWPEKKATQSDCIGHKINDFYQCND